MDEKNTYNSQYANELVVSALIAVSKTAPGDLGGFSRVISIGMVERDTGLSDICHESMTPITFIFNNSHKTLGRKSLC